MKAKKLPKSHVFNGKRYKIIWKRPYPDEGKCAPPDEPAETRVLRINPSTKNEKEYFNTLIHEAGHAALWLLDEEAVTRVADELTDFLWKCGFRLEK